MTDLSDRVRIEKDQVAFDGHYKIRKVEFSWRRSDGEWQRQTHEVFERGSAATILLYDRSGRTVILTKQFRLPAWLSGYREMLVEAAAGILDGKSPEERIVQEAKEETGYNPRHVRKLFALFMSPGAVTERIHFFTGEYDADDKTGDGGGLAAEGEDIEVLELPFDQALAMIGDGRICDAKTVILLQHAGANIFPKRTAQRPHERGVNPALRR